MMYRNDTDRNADNVEIDGKKFTKRIIEVIIGEREVEELKEDWLPIAEALEHPDRLPFLVSDILKVEKTSKLRRALIRVQINAKLRTDEDLDFYKKQLFAAETIEILLFKNLRLKPKKRKKKKEESEEEDEEESEEEEVEEKEGQAEEEQGKRSAQVPKDKVIEELTQLSGVGPSKAEKLYENGYRSVEGLKKASEEELKEIKGIGSALAAKILEALEEFGG